MYFDHSVGRTPRWFDAQILEESQSTEPCIYSTPPTSTSLNYFEDAAAVDLYLLFVHL